MHNFLHEYTSGFTRTLKVLEIAVSVGKFLNFSANLLYPTQIVKCLKEQTDLQGKNYCSHVVEELKKTDLPVSLSLVFLKNAGSFCSKRVQTLQPCHPVYSSYPCYPSFPCHPLVLVILVIIIPAQLSQ